jgi:uncharacterized protein YqgC (DUF456 family)
VITAIFYLLLLFGAALSWLLALISLPGLWLMTALAAIYSLFTHEQYIGARTLLLLLFLTIVAELLDLLVAGAAARQAGGGKKSALGAIIGGVIGGIAFSIIPIPIVATILGIAIGTFVGAAGTELYGGGKVQHSVRVGVGALKGRAYGFAGKLLVGCGMMLVILVMGWP